MVDWLCLQIHGAPVHRALPQKETLVEKTESSGIYPNKHLNSYLIFTFGSSLKA